LQTKEQNINISEFKITNRKFGDIWSDCIKLQIFLITLRLNFNQVAMEGTGLTHVGQPLTGQLVNPAAGRKAGPVESLGH